jgi:hypothetical protein
MMTRKSGGALRTAIKDCGGLGRDYGDGGKTMKTVIAAIVLGLGLHLSNASVALADGWGWFKPAPQWGLLTVDQRRAYQACLYAAHIYDYCHENARSVGACIIANGGANFPVDGHRFTDDYCWYAAQDVK